VTIFLASNAADTVEEDAALRLASAVLGADLAPPTCGVDAAADLELVDAFPDTDAGMAAANLFEVLQDPDDATARAFIEDHVADELADGRSTDELLDVVSGVRDELAGFTIDEIARQDPFTFHVRLNVPATGQVVVSVAASENEPARLHCIDIGA
jgi:hypothetical protein